MKLLAWTVFLNLSIMTTWSCNPKLNINIILTLWQDDRYVKLNIFEINQLRWLASLSQHTCLQHSFVVPFVAYRGLRKLTATWRLSAELKRRRLAKMKGRLAAESLTGFQRLSHQISAADRSKCNSDTDLSLCIFILVTVHISAAMKISFPLVTVLLHLVFSSIPQWYSPFANMTLTLYFSGKYFHSLVPLCNNKEVVHAKARGLLPRSLFF